MSRAKEYDDPPLAMPKTIRLKMEPEDLDGAVCNSRQHCVIAQTIYRSLNLDIGRVRVTQAGVSIAKGGHRHYYRVPVPAAKVVRDFDAGRPVTLIPFLLRLTNRTKIRPVDPARQSKININRRAQTAMLDAMGLKPKKYPGRYGI